MSSGIHPHDNREQIDMAGATASAAIAEGVFCRIDIATGNTISTFTSAAGERLMGVSVEAADAAGDEIQLTCKGIARVQVGQALVRTTAGHYLLTSNATGQAVPFTAGTNKLLAKWLPSGGADPSGAGEFITVQLLSEAEVGALNSQVQTAALTVGVEALDAIPVTVQITDADGGTVGAVTRCLAEVFDDSMDRVAAAGTFSINETGAGAEVSNTVGGVGALIFTTDNTGAATLSITDTSAISTDTVRLVVTPLDNLGGGSVAFSASDADLTFA